MRKVYWKNNLSMAMAAVVAASSLAMSVAAAEPASESRDGEMIYATVNMPYADFYFGELTDLAAGTQTEPQLNVEDPVEAAGFRDEGQYDAVTSATNSKSKRFEATYYEEGEGTTVQILGLKDVQVAVPRELYDNARQALENGEACSNELLDFIEAMEVSDTAFEEYKVLNADGTFSKMVTETETPNANVSITTESVWGNYQISIEMEGVEITTEELLGAVLETTDGAKYGLKHLDNLWLRTGEIAFAVEPNFVEPHGNTIEYKRFEDIQGKSVKSVTYLLKNKPDVVIQAGDLKCKRLLGENYSGTAQETAYVASGTAVPLTLTLPQGSAYQLASLEGSTGVCDTSSYSYANGVLTLNGTCHPGAYTATFSDDEYENLKVDVVVKSNMAAENIKIAYNRLSFQDSVSTMEEYLNEITSVTVNGTTITSSGVGPIIFGADGTIDFDAKTTGRGATVIFPEGAAGDYTLVIKAAGFPDVTAKVGASYVEKQAQTIQGASSVVKTYGDGAFSLQATAEGALSYASSNTNVVRVDATGKVSIVGAGSAVITIQAAETATKKAASKTVAVTVQKATPVITASSYEKTYGNKAFDLKASSTAGALTYQSGNSKVATVTAAGKVTLKGTGKAVITLVSAETANYKRAEKKITVTVKPKKATLSKAKAGAAKKAVVQWKKDAKASGYEIVVATNKKFTKNVKKIQVASKKTTKKTISGLKSGKKYFVKVRAYAKAQGGKVYGAYSKAKPVTVK